MLLLMNQDPLVFRSLTERRRYAPLLLGLTAYLAISAVAGALQKAGAVSARSPFVMEQKQPSGVWLLVKNLGLLALAMPNHFLFLRVWQRTSCSIPWVSLLCHHACWLCPDTLTNACLTVSTLYILDTTSAKVLKTPVSPASFLLDSIDSLFIPLTADNNSLIHVPSVQYVWARKGAPGAFLVGMAPLSAAASLLTDLQSVRLLSGLAIAMSAIQFIHMRSVHHEGLRII